MLLLAALLLATLPAASRTQIWNCSADYAHEGSGMRINMPFWGPDDPLIQRPYLSIHVGDFAYEWKPVARILRDPFRDPDRMAFGLPLSRKPLHGHVKLTAPGERPIRLKLVEYSLLGWDRRHGAYLQVKDPRATARLSAVPRWTATVTDRRGRVQEVTEVAPPSRAQVRTLYELARTQMTKAARDPSRSPLCELQEPGEDPAAII